MMQTAANATRTFQMTCLCVIVIVVCCRARAVRDPFIICNITNTELPSDGVFIQ